MDNDNSESTTSTDTDPVETMFRFVTELMVHNPKNLQVTFEKGVATTIVTVKPYSPDSPLLIGEKGRTFKALKDILFYASEKFDWQYTLHSIDSSGEPSGKKMELRRGGWTVQASVNVIQVIMNVCASNPFVVSPLKDTVEVVVHQDEWFDDERWKEALYTVLNAIAAMRGQRAYLSYSRRKLEYQPNENKGRFCA